MGSGKILLGLVAAVAAGATLGVLFAPDKGSSTRKKIARKGDDYAGALGEKFNKFSDDITGKFENMSEQALSMLKNGKPKEEAKVVEPSAIRKS